MESFLIKNSGNTSLYKITGDKKFYGFAVKGEEAEETYLLSPRELPKILETLFTKKEIL